MFRNISAWHVIVVLVVVLLLFGANRLPGLAKSIGQSLKIFKNEIKDLSDDGRRDDATTPTGTTATGATAPDPLTGQGGGTDVPPPPAPPAPPRP